MLSTGSADEMFDFSFYELILVDSFQIHREWGRMFWRGLCRIHYLILDFLVSPAKMRREIIKKRKQIEPSKGVHYFIPIERIHIYLVSNYIFRNNGYS